MYKRKQLFLSIVIPVYNVEKYLEECINSILQQSLEENEYEIILVDDGSTDDSGKICDKYTFDYSNIQVVHQKNKGLSGARNTGIKRAIGEYVLFVDADDYIEKESLKRIKETTLNLKYIPDVTFLNAIKIYPDQKKVPLNDGYVKEKIINKNASDVLKHIASIIKFPASACTKLFNLSFLKQNDLYFLEGMFSEDVEWTIRVLNLAKTFNCIEEPYYYYRQNRISSITNSIKFQSVSGILHSLEFWENTQSENRNEIFSFLSYEYVILLLMFNRIEKEKRNILYTYLLKYKYILKYSKYKKVKIVSYFMNIFGIKITAYVLSVLKR